MNTQKLLPFFSILVLFALWPSSAEAQQLRSAGDIGIGGQIGSPSGLTIKVYNPNAVSYELLAAWDLDNFYFFNVHGLHEQHFGNSERAHIFVGPGAYVGFRERSGRSNDTVAGISGTIGVGFLFMPAEFFAQITPRLDLTPATEGDIGGGIGVRFYF